MSHEICKWVEMAIILSGGGGGDFFSVFERLRKTVKITRVLQWFELPLHLCLILVTEV